MKIELRGNRISAHSESIQDNVTLMEVFERSGTKNTTILAPINNTPISVHIPTKQKHSKHLFKKVCSVCGRECKGRAGLGIHMRKSHKEASVLKSPIVRGYKRQGMRISETAKEAVREAVKNGATGKVVCDTYRISTGALYNILNPDYAQKLRERKAQKVHITKVAPYVPLNEFVNKMTSDSIAHNEQ